MLRQSFHLQLGRTEASIYTHISLRALLQCSHSVSLSLTSTHHNQSCLSDSAAISTTCITCILWQQNYTNSLFIPSLESGRRAGRTCASLVTMVRLHLNATRTTSQLCTSPNYRNIHNETPKPTSQLFSIVHHSLECPLNQPIPYLHSPQSVVFERIFDSPLRIGRASPAA